jgi:hypothetical protein
VVTTDSGHLDAQHNNQVTEKLSFTFFFLFISNVEKKRGGRKETSKFLNQSAEYTHMQ